MVTDPIANMLINIKNCQMVGRKSLKLDYSKSKEAIAKILTDYGYLDNSKIIGNYPKKYIELYLSNKPIIHMKLLSKPGHRMYRGSRYIPRPLRGQGLVIISTSRGIMSGKEATKHGIGGELICEVF